MNKRYLVFAGIGMELVGLILAALWLGKTIDDTYGLKGIGVITMSIGALVGWLVHLITLLKSIDRAEELAELKGSKNAGEDD